MPEFNPMLIDNLAASYYWPTLYSLGYKGFVDDAIDAGVLDEIIENHIKENLGLNVDAYYEEIPGLVDAVVNRILDCDCSPP